MAGENFPDGLKVLVVDDDLSCLKIIESMLKKCNYEVTTAREAILALELLRDDKNKFDIVISDVIMPGMDGFELLEVIIYELDIPVIMLSGDDNPELVMKGVKHGAVDYLVKPVRYEELQNIWQHVVRKNMNKEKAKVNHGLNVGTHASLTLSIGGDESASQKDARSGKGKEKKVVAGDADEDNEYGDGDNDNNGDSNTKKRHRFVWCTKHHKRFITAIEQLGPNNVYPKKILDIMNVEGLTRESVASHLQKYKQYLRKIGSMNIQATDAAAATALGIHDPYAYMPNPYDMYGSLGNQINSMSLYSPVNQSHYAATNVQPTVGVIPSLEDYTRNMEIWMNLSNPQQNMVYGNQLPPNTFNDFSYLHNATAEQPFAPAFSTQDYSFPPQNVVQDPNAFNMDTLMVPQNVVQETNVYNMDGLLVPTIGSSNQSLTYNNSLQYNNPFDNQDVQMSAIGASSFMQNVEVQVQDNNEVGAPMPLDDNYLIETTDLLEDMGDFFEKSTIG